MEDEGEATGCRYRRVSVRMLVEIEQNGYIKVIEKKNHYQAASLSHQDRSIRRLRGGTPRKPLAQDDVADPALYPELE